MNIGALDRVLSRGVLVIEQALRRMNGAIPQASLNWRAVLGSGIVSAGLAAAANAQCQECNLGTYRPKFPYVVPDRDYNNPVDLPLNPCEMTQYVERMTNGGFRWVVKHGAHIKTGMTPQGNLPSPFDPVAYAWESAKFGDFLSQNWSHSYTANCLFSGEGYPKFNNLCNDPTHPTVLSAISRANLLLSRFPSLGDFLPAGATLGASSLALVSHQDAGTGTGWQGHARPVLGESVDLITGMELAQVCDLQLPFGTSTFRLMRTRSGTHKFADHHPANGGLTCDQDVDDAWWDWTGAGWMASENPVLLVDAAWPDVVGGQGIPNLESEAYPRGNWLVLDAHRSIPFQQVHLPPLNGGPPRIAYEAPPRFRARMKHNGVWGIIPNVAGNGSGPGEGTTRYGWTQRPTQFDVWLYEDAVHYTFVVDWEDVPVKDFTNNGVKKITSLNERPLWGEDYSGPFADEQPGYGLPYIGLCTRIEDRNQNRADIFYAPIVRHTVDLDTTPGCIECMQLGLRKGQINHIELSSIHASGEREIDWTLLYVHRFGYKGDASQQASVNNWNLSDGGEFDLEHWQSGDAQIKNDAWAMTGTVAIDRIYVYPGEVQQLHEIDPRTIVPEEVPTWEPVRFNVDPVDPVNMAVEDWAFRVHYRYQGIDNPEQAYQVLPLYPFRLLWTEVTSRERNGEGEPLPDKESRAHTFYRYVATHDGAGTDHMKNLQALERIYTNEDFANLKKWRDDSADGQGWRADLAADLAGLTPEDFALAQMNYPPGFAEPVVIGGNPHPQAQELVESYSSIRWGRRETYSDLPVFTQPPPPAPVAPPGWHPDGSWYCPDPEVVKQIYLTSVSDFTALALDNALVGDARGAEHMGPQQPGLLSVSTGPGQSRHWRIFRLVLQPVGFALVNGEPFHLEGSQYPGWAGGSMDPDASVFAHPYRWRAYEDPALGMSAQIDGLRTPEANKARWIVILDEFSSREAMVDTTQVYGDDADYPVISEEYATKKGQISRRVVEMNAAGHVLRDKTWEFKSGEVIQSGGGLGEQFHYSRVEELFTAGQLAPLLDLIEIDDPWVKNNGSDTEKLLNRQKQLDAFKKELVLTQSRSVGWSAAELANSGEDDGLVVFHEYALLGGSQPLTEVPLKARVQMIATGVQRGAKLDDTANWPPNYLQPVPAYRRYTKQWFYDDLCPTNLLGEVDLLTNEAGATPLDDLPDPGVPTTQTDGMRFSWTQVEREASANEVPKTDARVLWTKVVQSPKRIRPGSEWYYPVAMHVSDGDKGQGTWAVTGLVRDPSNPNAVVDNQQSLVFNYTGYHSYGREFEVVDVAMPQSGDTINATSKRPLEQTNYPNPKVFAFKTDALPSNWKTRIGATDPLHYVTHYEYDWGGVHVTTYFPNGRMWMRRFVTLYPDDENGNSQDFKLEPGASASAPWTILPPGSEMLVREFIFNDVEVITDDQGYLIQAKPRAMGQVREFKGEDFSQCFKSQTSPYEPSPAQKFSRLIPLKTRRVQFAEFGAGVHEQEEITDFVFYSVPQKDQPYFFALAEQVVVPDEYGRMTSVEMMDCNVDGVMQRVGTQQINDLGEVHRTREFDGTITRVVKNSIGQALRKYVGTLDDAWTQAGGGSLPPGEPNNLVLVERTEWGTGIHNAWLPTVVRRYTTNAFGNPWHNEPWGQAPTNDPDGQATITGYDWRMRPVKVEVCETGDPLVTGTDRLSTTLTYLDNASRPVMTAVYGLRTSNDAIPASIDPTGFGPADVIPTPNTLLSQSIKPISLSETVYASDGSVLERRDYDVSASASPVYRASFSYTGFGGATTFQLSGESSQTAVVDALGRVTSSSTIATRTVAGKLDYAYEVARTDTAYDPDGNARFVTRWERVDNAPGSAPTLGGPNAVWSMSVNWYDAEKRLIATADLGAGANAETIMLPLSPTSSTYTSSSSGNGPQPPPWFGLQTNMDLYPRIEPPMSGTGAGVVFRGGENGVNAVPSGVPLTLYHFDMRGRNDYTATPKAMLSGGANEYEVTKLEYSGLGKVIKKIENAFENDANKRRETRYEYQFGRVARVIVDTDGEVGEPGQGGTQWTALDFGYNEANNHGAEVVDLGVVDANPAQTGVVSNNASAVRAMYLMDTAPPPLVQVEGGPAPGPINGTPEHFFFRYDFMGRLCERIDARGVAMRYRYDDLDRLKSIEVGHYSSLEPTAAFTPGYPDSMAQPGGSGAPADMVGYVEYKYAEDGVPLTAAGGTAALGAGTFEVRAYTMKTGGTLIAFNRMEIDRRSNLTADIQMLGTADLTLPDIPKTAYTWNYVGTSVNATGEVTVAGRNRLTTMAYPDPIGAWPARTVTLLYGAAGSLDDSLSRITQINSAPGANPVSTFSYIGSGRRAGFVLGNAVVAQNFGLAPLTGSTRGLTSLDCFGRPNTIDYRSGSITGASMVRLDYTYDQAGNRLSEERTPQPGGSAGTKRKQVNQYDGLGRMDDSEVDNVSAGGTPSDWFRQQWGLDALGNWSQVQTNFLANAATEAREHNYLNEIESKQVNGGATLQPVYDFAGNLKYDGQFVYQYDAWNRLCQVTLPNINGPPGTPGTLVKHYLYDGVGRLIRVQSPYPDPATGELSDEVRSERLFYDGVRRVQELVTDPLPDTASAAQQGNTAAQQTISTQSGANQNSTSAGAENSMLGTGGGGGLPSGLSLAREYVWGPGDRGIDELLCQYGPTRLPSYPLHDGGGDIIALVDKNGAGGTPRLLWQATYDAYGQVVEEQTLVAGHTYLHAGHKGLFFDRLDSGIVDPVTFQETPRLMPAGHAGGGGASGSARLIGYARNRHLHTGFGRWLQRDPNATGLSVVGQQAIHGQGISPWLSMFDLMGLYGDGTNVFEYLKDSPLAGSDVLGLYDSDEYIEDLLTANFSLPDPGSFITGVLQSLVDGYSANLNWDVEWAADWSTDDDWHSRTDSSWIIFAIGKGLYDAFEIGFGNYKINPLDAFGDSKGPRTKTKKTPHGLSRLSKIYTVDGYSATAYSNPKSSRNFVVFDKAAVKREVKVSVSTRPAERAEANRLCGFKSNPPGWVWHHHSWKRGTMQLVPERLHQLVAHIGKAMW